MNDEVEGGMTEALGEHGTNPVRPRTSGWQVPVAHCPGCGWYGPPSAGTCVKCMGDTVEEEFTLSSCENRIKAQFEQWVRRRAKRAFEEEDDVMAADALRSVYLSDFADGHYNWSEERGGKYVAKALMSGQGFSYLVYLLLRRCHPRVTEKQAYTLADANTAGFALGFRWALGNSDAPADKEVVGASPRERKEANGKTSGKAPPSVLSKAEEEQLKGLLEKMATPEKAVTP